MHKRHQVQGLFLCSSAPWDTGRSCCSPVPQAEHISLMWSRSGVSYGGCTFEPVPPASGHMCILTDSVANPGVHGSLPAGEICRWE